MSWIPKAFRLLPGHLAMRLVAATIILVAFFVGLHFFYSWLGNAMLDPGGTIG